MAIRRPLRGCVSSHYSMRACEPDKCTGVQPFRVFCLHRNTSSHGMGSCVHRDFFFLVSTQGRTVSWLLGTHYAHLAGHTAAAEEAVASIRFEPGNSR